MADGGSMDLGRILGAVIEDAARQLENVGKNASGIASDLDGATKSAKGFNKELRNTVDNIHDIDDALDDFGGEVFEEEIKSAKQLQKEYRETANQFLDMQKKAGNFKGFASDDKLSREVTKQFNLIKKGEAELWQAQTRVRRAAKEIAQAQLPTAQFEKIGDSIDQATQKLGAFLEEIRDVVKEINNKNLGFNFNLTDTQGQTERLEQYKSAWRSYGQAVGDALNEVARLSNDREFKASAGPDFQKQIAQVGMLAFEYDAMQKSFQKSMQSVKTFAGADTAGRQLQEYAAKIQPVIEKARELGKSNFDINRFLKPEIPQDSIDQAAKLQTIISGMTGQMKEINSATAGNIDGGGGATASLTSEAGAIEKLNALYELHKTAVESAVKAEAEKTAVSKQLLDALLKENEAMGMSDGKNWFDNMTDTASSIKTATESINALLQVLGQLNNTGGNIEQNLNEPLRKTGERLREVDITYLESQLRMAGARMEALQVPTDDMTSSLAAMEDALARYQDEDLPVKQRNEALSSFNENLKTANQLIREQTYLDRLAKKELDDLTSSQDGLNRPTKEQKAAFDDAKRAVQDYYKALGMLLKDQKAYADIKLTPTGYQSESGNYSALAAELNRTKTAYDLVTDAQNKNQLSAEGIVKLQQTLAEKERQYQIQVEQTANKEREAAEKAADAARKKQEQAEATERAAKAKQAEAMASQQLKASKQQESSAQDQINKQYKSMIDLLHKIKTERANKQNALASGDLIKAADADRYLKKYIESYRELKREIGGKLSADQLKGITAELQEQKRAIDARNAAAKQAAQNEAVKADEGALKSAVSEYNEITKAFQQLKTESASTKEAMLALDAAMAAVKSTNAGTEERATAMTALTQAAITAKTAIDAAAESERQEADAAAKAADAERQKADADKQATAAREERQRGESQRISMLAQLQKELDKAEAAERRFAAAQRIDGLKGTYGRLKETTAGLRGLIEQLKDAPAPTIAMRDEFTRLRGELSHVTSDLKAGGNVFSRWLSNGVGQLQSRLTQTLGLAAVVTKSVQEIKKMISTAVELDSAMNTLQIVTRSSGAEMDAYGKRVSSMAKETAQATKDLIDATTVYARLGYSMDESAILSKYTAMLQGVGGIDASAAQDAVTAIVKAFGKGVDDIEDIMDKMVVVGNNFPISVSQIAEGMNNAGSMLAVAGNSFEESIALLTAANTTIQNISKASTGLRTIAARIRKTNTEEDGGEVIEEAKYQEMVNALTKQHVSLVDKVTGQYRSTYEVMRDISKVWDKMNSMEQAAVIEALAGTRQQNIFTSLITQFREAEKAVQRMDNATGELQESYDIYLESIQAHVQTLKAAYDELSRDFVDSGFAKSAVDLLTKIVEALDLLVEKFGVLKTVLGALGGVAILKNIKALTSLFFVTEATRHGQWLFDAPGRIEKFAVALTKLGAAASTAAPLLIPLLAALAAGAVAKKVIDGRSFESASEQVAATKSELDKLEQQQSDILARWNALNDVKARGDFSVQQETELTLLTAQKEALEAQVALLKDKYELEKAHERDAARAAVGKLLADADDPNGYSTEQAVAAYRDAKKRYDKLNIFGRRSKGAQNNLDAVTNILNGQIQTYQNALKVLDPEEDADEIARIKNDILEITSAISDIPIEVLRARSELEKLQIGGKVKLLQRPVIDAKILEAAGWGEFEDGEGATLFSSTYSNEDKTIAMNFTPIITDVDGNYIGAFTPEQLQQYAEGVIAGTQEDTLGLKIGATFEGPDAIEQAESEAQKVHELHELVYEQDLKKIQKFHRDVKRLSNDTMNAIKKYVTDGTELTEQQARELQEIFDSSELSVENFSRMLSQMFAEPPDGLSKTLEKSIADLAGFNDELEDINTGFERFEKHMEGGEKDDAVKKAAEIYKGVLEDLQSDRIDTNRVRAAAELFLGKDRLKEIGYDLQKAAQELQGSVWQYLFDPNEESSLDYGQRFAEYVRQNFSQLDGVWVEGGNNFFYKNMQAVADAFDMSTESVGMFLSALDMYGVNVMRSVDDTAELINRFYELKSTLGSTQEAVTQVVNELYSDGYDSFEIYSVLDQLQQTGVIDLDKDQLYDSIDEALTKLDELNNKKSEPTTDMNYEPFAASYQVVVDMMKQLNQLTANPTVTMNYAERDVSDLDTKSNSSTNNNTQSAAGFYTKARAGARAGGKQAGSAGGKTLVNEDGPELISDDGRAFIANGGKPGFVYLTKDAIVFNAEDTDEILRRGRFNGTVPAFAKGTGTTSRSGLIGRLLSGREYPAKRQIKGTQVGGSSTSYTKPSQHSTSTHTNTTSYTTYSTYSNTSWICPNCGRLCGANASYCYGCGWPDHMQQELPQTTSSFYPDESGTMRVEYGDGQEYTYETGYDYSLQFQIAEAQRAHDEAVKALRAAQATNAAAQGYSITPTGSKGTGGGSGYAGSGGGNYVGGADYASASDPQKVDWIAVRINRLQRTIADLEKVASSGFKKLDLRLSKTKDQIAKTTEEIGVMNSAYNRYMQEANSVGLDSSIAGKVQNGTIDITEYDEETRKKIDQYTEWFEKALDAQSAVEELHQNIAQLYVDSFEMVQTDFENQLAQIEHDANTTSKNLEMAQTRGYLDNASFYQQLADNQTSQIAKMKTELDGLNQKMKEAMASGEIAEGSEAWYQMKQSINEVEEAIADANIQLVEYQRTIRKLSWDYFDYAQERFAQMGEEAQFFIDLMSNHDLFQENGQFNQLGEATAGMHAVNYDAYMAQADAYAQEILKIQKDLESDPNDTELIARREQLLQLQRQSVLSAEGEKNAIKDLVQNGINLELEALKDLIDAYSDSLDSAKDLYEYQKNITEKTADIASMQKQLSAYQNDDSEETRARVQKLNKDLEKAQDELREAEWDRSISDQKKLLDEVYDEYEEYLNQRLDNIDLLMQEMIAGTNMNMDSIRNTLTEVGNEVGYSMTDQLAQAMSADLTYYDHMSTEISSVQTVLNNIYSMVAAMARASGAVKAYATGGLVDYTGLAAVHGSKGRPELMLNASDTANFLEAAKMMREMAGTTLSIPTAPGFGSGGGMTIGQLQVNIPIDRVLDYNDLITQLRDDPKFERLVNAMTLDRAVGKSAFGKNRIVF